MGQGASTVTACSGNPSRVQEDEDDDEREGHRKEQDEEEEEVEDGNDWTLYAPDECVASVFRKLPTADRNRCALVCKRWHRVEGQGRQRLSLHAVAELGLALPGLLDRFPHITKLALKCDRRTVSIDDETLCSVGRACRQLQKVKLKACKGLSDRGLEEFAELVSGTLRKFSCGSCQFGPRGINAVLYHCSNLEDLTVKRLRGFVMPNPSTAEHVLPGSCSIKRLCVKDLPSAQLLGPLIAGSKSLHTLILSRVPGNWDLLLEIITEHTTSPVEFHMEKVGVTDRGLKAVARWSNLQVLYLVKPTECTNQGLSAVASGCPLLRKLHVDVMKSSRVGDEGLLMVARKCRHLQELVIIGVSATSASLSLVASECSRLERLAICTSDTFGDPELSCIADKCLALKKLCIKGCPISDRGMEALVSGCPSLVKMKVKKCRNVTPASVACLNSNRVSLVVTLDAPSTTSNAAHLLCIGGRCAERCTTWTG
ncbi:F-box protein At1g47056 isoform X2 [Physcomitrium patens]|uniref:F-box protein At1g47056 isoform X2 n=1 Tax=Physcomitrium patens TaxID=3218 RepID=UPI000D16093C|nr:F-box protein At1g47056-like isoform X2 [Physcomitrium patens]|eukprot:XP_024395202.1 F-box protein At1g47056-like isoform X2 [Physcomitrella patens]